ncbi:uncharacterized protein [Clytia hemisphaerica]
MRSIIIILLIIFITVYGLYADECSCENPCSPGFRCTRCNDRTGYGSRWCNGELKCQPCSKGRYSNRPNCDKHCMDCEKGYYSDVRGATECKPCPAGHSCDFFNKPIKCRRGYHNPQIANPLGCQPCGKGKYSDQIGALECKTCPVGHWCHSWVNKYATPCYWGQYQDEVGQTTCKICEAGTYTDKRRSTRCTPCGLGQYQPSFIYFGNQRADCKRCGEGTYSDVEGAVKCKTCPKGHYCPKYWVNHPLKCPPRKYQDQPGRVACKWCKPGTYNLKEGASKCELCPAGSKCIHGFPIICHYKYYSPEGSDECLKCPRKHFCPIPSLEPIPESNNRMIKTLIHKAALLSEETYHRKHSEGKTVYGFVEYRYDFIVVAFRGTDTWEDRLTDALVVKKSYSGCGGCQVHTGFLNSYSIVRKPMLEKVDILTRKHPKAKILATGHSLGGAKAALAAYELSMRGYLVDYVTFGSPRPGNVIFANNVNRAVRGMNLRVTFGRDIATVVPPKNSGYSHIGKEIHFTDQSTMHELPGYVDYAYGALRRNSFWDHKMKNGYRWLR